MPIVEVMVAESECERRDLEIGAGRLVRMCVVYKTYQDYAVMGANRELCESASSVAETFAAPRRRATPGTLS